MSHLILFLSVTSQYCFPCRVQTQLENWSSQRSPSCSLCSRSLPPQHLDFNFPTIWSHQLCRLCAWHVKDRTGQCSEQNLTHPSFRCVYILYMKSVQDQRRIPQRHVNKTRTRSATSPQAEIRSCSHGCPDTRRGRCRRNVPLVEESC